MTNCGRRFFRCAMTAILVFTMLLWGCDYARMYDQDAVKTYGKKMGALDPRTVPLSDGFVALSHTDPSSLRNPLPHSQQTVERGRTTYEYFCVHCHGPELDGRGTVGQSIVPLPADLTSPTVLSRGNGVLYKRIRLGYNRHPALFSTLPADDAWAVITYVRSKGGL